MEATGKKVRRANAMFYDEKHPFMLADVDRMVVNENAGLECKTASQINGRTAGFHCITNCNAIIICPCAIQMPGISQF